MIRKSALLSVAAFGLAAAMPLRGETTLPVAFQKYLASPVFTARLSDMLAMAKKNHFAACETVRTGANPQVTVMSPVTVGSDGLPASGQWKVSVPAEGCGKARIVNAFFLVGKDDKVHFLLAIPGTTRGDFRLQSDTVMYVLMAAAKQTKDCKGAAISDTRFDAEDPIPDSKSVGGINLQIQRVWHETWTIDGCGHLYDVRVDYMVGPTGTTIMASSDNVVERPADTPKP